MRPELKEEALRLARSARVGEGKVWYLINRPVEGVHEPSGELYLDSETGIRGDRWMDTAWIRLPDGRPDPRVQVSMTNLRVMACFTGREAEQLHRCGDNLYTDLNLTEASLPVGSCISIGEAMLEVSDVVNDACGKFAQRFGAEAFKFVRESQNEALRLRGIFCRIVESGWVRKEDDLKVL